jgi:hypothetical protein
MKKGKKKKGKGRVKNDLGAGDASGHRWIEAS